MKRKAKIIISTAATIALVCAGGVWYFTSQPHTTRIATEVGEESKEPNPLAKGMSYMKTNVKTVLEPGDKTVADLVTDGCHMGVKSLERYLNQYQNAEQRVKSIAEKLIKIEKNLADDIAAYL